jgi:hypothetical protein
MFHRKKSIAVIVAALLISIGSSPLSQAIDPPIDDNAYEEASTSADILAVLAPGSTITIFQTALFSKTLSTLFLPLTR